MLKCLFKGHIWFITRRGMFGRNDYMCKRCGKEIIG
jgi:hypothetical protein